MEIWTHTWHTMLMYLIVFTALRIMGKREIGKLSVFDLVISFMLAEIAVFAIEDVGKPLWHSLLPMLILVIIQVTIAWVSLKSRRARAWVDGKPSVIIAQGHINRKEMHRLRYNLDDLLLQLREQGIDNLNEVEYAIIESTGKLTVFLKDLYRSESNEDEKLHVEQDVKSFPTVISIENSKTKQSSSHPVTVNLMQRLNKGEASHSSTGNGAAAGVASTIKRIEKRRSGIAPVIKQPERIRFTELPMPLIMDGRVLDQNLERINKTRFWLKSQIHQKGIRDFKEVFLCSIDHKGYMYVDKKDALK